MNPMPSISIHNVRCERLSEKAERLVLGATVRGVERQIVVDVGRYEKRPFFVIQDVGALCDYQAEAMRALLNQVVLAYAETQDAMNISESL